MNTHDFARSSRVLVVLAILGTTLICVGLALGGRDGGAPGLGLVLLGGALSIASFGGAVLLAVPPYPGATRRAWAEYAVAVAVTAPPVVLIAYGLVGLGRSVS